METVKKVTSPSVGEIFASMEYGPAPESDKIAQNWMIITESLVCSSTMNGFTQREGKPMKQKAQQQEPFYPAQPRVTVRMLTKLWVLLGRHTTHGAN